MKLFLSISIFCLLAVISNAQSANPNYDSLLAKKLNADEYGMKSYVMVLLKTGSNDTKDKKFIDSCFRGHMANIEHMVKIGKLCVAGPMGKNENSIRGIFILNVTTFEEAGELLKKDPAINAELLKSELYHWYGSAALPEYLNVSDKIWKKNH